MNDYLLKNDRDRDCPTDGGDRFQIEVDNAIFSVDLDRHRVLVLLVRQRNSSRFDRWCLPGTFVRLGESLEAAAHRIMSERIRARNLYLEQLYTFDGHSDPLDDRLSHQQLPPPDDGNLTLENPYISVSYFALVRWDEARIMGEGAIGTSWYPLNQVPPLIANYDRILQYGYKRLRNKLEYSPVAFEVLPETFTLSEVYQLYTAVLGEDFSDYSNFRSRLLKLGFLSDTGQKVSRGAGRPASLYRFDARAFEPLKDKPMVFI